MKKPVVIVSHLLFWVFTALSSPYIFDRFFFMVTYHIQHPEPSGPYHSYHYEIEYPAIMIVTGIGVLFFYTSYFSLSFFLKRPLRFTWIVLFYIICSLVISLPADFVSEQAGMYLGPIMYFNVCGFVFKALVEWANDRKQRIALEKDRVASQLELLKAQIDPHFLFNNLNNIDVFIQEDPQRASEYLGKLSDILRFMLYEADTEKVPLTKEIEYIRKYIDLQKIRTSNVNFVRYEIKGDPDNKRISPMILIHFIENAFKFASNKKIEDAVVIGLTMSGNNLSFSCKNHIGVARDLTSVKKGKGIELLKQKLDLLYRKDYRLTVKEENNWYLVNLDIPLDEH